MHVWALADLHLAFGDPNKDMAVFGEPWIGYAEKIQHAWQERVSPEDLVLIPGDISWAKHLQEALIDLEWIEALPGTKILTKGNHDYWWESIGKLRRALPPSIHALQYDCLTWQDFSIAGTRLWDDHELDFDQYIDEIPNPQVRQSFYPTEAQMRANEKIFERELLRLERALEQLNPNAKARIAMVHYPPIGADLAPSRTSLLLEKYKVDYCVFGHLHSVKPTMPPFGTRNGVHYLFVAADHVNFTPIQVL